MRNGSPSFSDLEIPAPAPGKMMQETSVVTDESPDYDSFDEQNYDRPTERWAPLGAAVSPTPSPAESSHMSESDQLKVLEEEQEQLNSSLLALTTHFAQVQFRLKQIVTAEPDDRETLLKELEEFAFKGIPDVRGCKSQDAQILEEMSDKEHEIKICEQREKQRELIHQLKSQLEDLETYAYETGDKDVLPTNRLMEKQRVVIDELRHKLDLDLQNFDRLSTEELRQVVDHAIGQIVNPAKVKEKLVDQLKTQITDLERFIQFLQDISVEYSEIIRKSKTKESGEASSPGPLGKERCFCPVHKHPFDDQPDGSKECCQPSNKQKFKESKKQKHINETTASLMRKAVTMLQIYIISQLGCGSREFKRNLLKKTAKGNHWGDLRAKVELAIDKTLEKAHEEEEEAEVGDDSDDDYSEDSESANVSSPALTQCVRRDLAMAIRDLMQHGLMEIGQSSSMVQLGCFSGKSQRTTKTLHAWDLLLKYYEMKHGREYNESPARKLSQSFHLDIVGGKPITAKQTLLGAIDTVITTHTPLKRTEDSHFKAFVCLALNEKKLSTWLRLLFRTQTLIDLYYQDWSYVARTGFDDALKSLDRLNSINFKLPVDLAVRGFSNIKDAF